MCLDVFLSKLGTIQEGSCLSWKSSFHINVSGLSGSSTEDSSLETNPNENLCNVSSTGSPNSQYLRNSIKTSQEAPSERDFSRPQSEWPRHRSICARAGSWCGQRTKGMILGRGRGSYKKQKVEIQKSVSCRHICQTFSCISLSIISQFCS